MGRKLSTLAEAAREIKKIHDAASPSSTGDWTVFQALEHCAESIRYSMTGFPAMKPPFVRVTVGRLVSGFFLWRGAMSHDLAAPVPGAPGIEAKGDVKGAAADLLAVIEDFNTFDKPLAPHFLYGDRSKADYDKLHAMHIANHLDVIRY
jgi:hypothetical protein